MAPDESRRTGAYDPRTTRLLSFHDAIPAFLAGRDSPRDYLERCIAAIEALEPKVRAFAALNLEGARAAADASTKRYKEGLPLSVVDGLPIGIKDLYETIDMPTQMNSPVYNGWESKRDAACVYALRSYGAAILGKTTTTEFGIGEPDVTRNPFDLDRTPGGSSSGTSAAIGARMMPAGLGTQLKGSIIRPAGYCANYAIKPSFGALNRSGGHSTAPSGSHLGVHAGSLEDVWSIAYFLSTIAGPDPGHPGLNGGPALPVGQKPRRLIRMYTPGWDMTDDTSRAVFEDFLEALRRKDVEILEPADHPATALLESDFREVDDIVTQIVGFEMRWPMKAYRDRGPNLLSDKIEGYLTRGESLTIDDYRRCLAWRERLRNRFMAAAGLADGFVSLTSPGPAPLGLESTGNPIYQTPSTAAGAPSFALPLLAVDGLPQGVQLVGFAGGDDRLAGHAAWMVETFLRD